MAKRELGGGGTRERLVDSLARVVHLGTGAALALTPKLVIAISAHAVVMSDDPHEFDGLGQPPVGAPGLCLEIVNKSRASVRIDEVGLAGRYDEPWLAMAEPHLHDNKPWPRDLAPGEAVAAHLDSAIREHPAFGDVRRAWARTSENEIIYGRSDALRAFVRASSSI